MGVALVVVTATAAWHTPHLNLKTWQERAHHAVAVEVVANDPGGGRIIHQLRRECKGVKDGGGDGDGDGGCMVMPRLGPTLIRTYDAAVAAVVHGVVGQMHHVLRN